MPETGYCRAWFGNELKKRAGELFFGGLLNALAPERYARMEGHGTLFQPYDWRSHYFDLLDYCMTLFPICDYDFWIEDLSVQEVIWNGIPVGCMGVEALDGGYYSDYDLDDLESPAMALCISIGDGLPPEEFKAALGQYIGILPGWLFEPNRDHPIKITLKPPRGREWIEPWNGLPDLFEFANGMTGSSFLDYSQNYAFSGEIRLPAWTVDEIKSLATLWEHSKPIYDRAMALEDYVNRRPDMMLPLLAGAIRGDGAAMHEVTRKKEKR